CPCLFAPTPDAESPRTARNVHIRRVYDILNVSIQRRDLTRATRAWTILAHCKEVNWRVLWSTSVHILAEELDDTPRAHRFLTLAAALYAGLLSLYLAQPVEGGNSQSNPLLLRDAQSHFERAKALDPANAIADAFLRKIQHLNGADTRSGDESDDEVASDDPKPKRIRTSSY
ncbi:hypothetical protein FB451DRAFT_1202811, partial [Mycena latifolia]